MRISDWSSDVCSSDLAAGKFTVWVAIASDQWFRQTNSTSWPSSSRAAFAPSVVPPAPHIRSATSFGRARRAIRRPRSSRTAAKIGRASRRERVCQYVYISVVAVSLKKKNHEKENKIQLLQTKVARRPLGIYLD